MDHADAISTIVGAIIGAVAALGAVAWTFHRTAKESRRERLNGEITSMRALCMEINVALEIVKEMSPTLLPTLMLEAAMGGIHHMKNDQQEAIIRYSQSVLRYNGRVERIIAYGSGKRAFGKSPGSEKPEKQADRVIEAIPSALQAIDSHLRSSRFN